ncbi:MAG: fructose 1,6-bisphosphatase [Deltaproteobacteria bacterium]|nr:fructose 1,6-bisphosphatase [Deltaproteobacteria bacterium]MBW2087114.1 fructose 1,6-bisphosphatase [Deltaproteobacteria bacterium]
MRITLSAIKADIGSIGGHICPSQALLDRVQEFVKQRSKGVIIDFQVSSTGDDIAILCTHEQGVDSEKVHKLAWDAFVAGTEVAKEQGLYGAGQDLLKDAFSGNIKGMGPAVAELEFEERPNEPFLFFAADKTDPGAYNLPLYLGFTDPMHCAGLLLSPKMASGFKFTIMDVSYIEAERVIELNAPEELYDIAALLRDPERFVVEAIHSRTDGEVAVAVSTTRLQNIAGKYVGKDDPIMLVRTQGNFPATGEVLSPFSIAPLVAGFMRGSHTGPFMPVKRGSTVSYFDGPPVVSCSAFCVHEGQLTEPVDAFDHPFWDHVRDDVSRRALDIRRQGFFGAAMLPYSELEYGGIVEKMAKLDKKFTVRQ